MSDALANKDVPALTAFTDLYRTYPGERPAFVAFKIEVESDLKEADWVRRLIDRMGLYQYFPIAAGQTYSFALMEYKVEDVFRQGVPKVGNRPFALATVLECQNNPAFFPVPGGSEYGFTVDFSNHPSALPTVREVLHVRLDYVTSHVVRFGQVSGPASKPDLGVARQRHLAALRTRTGRHDFGA